MIHRDLMANKISSSRVDQVLKGCDLSGIDGLKEYVMKALAASGVTDGSRVTLDAVRQVITDAVAKAIK
jgi:hypothetical protein